MMRTNDGLFVLAAVLLALPLLLPNTYYFDIANRMAINAIIVLGLNLLIGFAGQISLGHAGFFGIGAYASAVLTTHFSWPPIAALCAGAAGAALLAAAIAPPIFRLRGHYLAMATLGLGIVISIVLKNEAGYTGGPDGMSVPAMSAFGWEIFGERQWYWLFAGILLFSVWACQNLIDSPFGRALRALHGSEVASQVVGVNVARYKVTIFVLSAFFASIMGSLTAHYVGFITPDSGGMASVFGSVVGAVLLTALPQALTTFEGRETVAFGAILMLSMIFLPKGLVPTLAAKFGGRR
jgi:branched-chain amino acid transport system permease protein